MPWITAYFPAGEDFSGASKPRDVLGIVDLAKEVDRSLQCRNCEKNCTLNTPRHAWGWMPLESEGRATLSPEAPCELRVKFQCSKCESIHLAVPLPSKGSGKPWSMADGAVRLIFAAIPKWVRRATGTPRKSNVRAAGAHEAPTSDAAHQAATSVAAARSIADAALAEAAGGADEAERERVQAARNDAAMERVASGKRPTRNPKRPTE